MRRGFSIFLILFFGLGPLSAFVDGSEDAVLAPCCRRHGKHHCAMDAQIMAMRAGRGIDLTPSFSAPITCPSYPGQSAAILMPAHALATAQAMACVALTSSMAPVRERLVARSITSRAHAGRGPPAANLS
jgi:hypothetical protein